MSKDDDVDMREKERDSQKGTVTIEDRKTGHTYPFEKRGDEFVLDVTKPVSGTRSGLETAKQVATILDRAHAKEDKNK